MPFRPVKVSLASVGTSGAMFFLLAGCSLNDPTVPSESTTRSHDGSTVSIKPVARVDTKVAIGESVPYSTRKLIKHFATWYGESAAPESALPIPTNASETIVFAVDASGQPLLAGRTRPGVSLTLDARTTADAIDRATGRNTEPGQAGKLTTKVEALLAEGRSFVTAPEVLNTLETALDDTGALRGSGVGVAKATASSAAFDLYSPAAGQLNVSLLSGEVFYDVGVEELRSGATIAVGVVGPQQIYSLTSTERRLRLSIVPGQQSSPQNVARVARVLVKFVLIAGLGLPNNTDTEKLIACSVNALLSSSAKAIESAVKSGDPTTIADVLGSALLASRPKQITCLLLYIDSQSGLQIAKSLIGQWAKFLVTAYSAAVFLNTDGAFIYELAGALSSPPAVFKRCAPPSGGPYRECSILTALDSGPTQATGLVSPPPDGFGGPVLTCNSTFVVSFSGSGSGLWYGRRVFTQTTFAQPPFSYTSNSPDLTTGIPVQAGGSVPWWQGGNSAGRDIIASFLVESRYFYEDDEGEHELDRSFLCNR